MNAHYRKLLEMTCQIAHVLKSKEVKKGGVVLIYMPSSPIAVAAMLACTRIGAVHWYVFVSSYSRPLANSGLVKAIAATMYSVVAVPSFLQP